MRISENICKSLNKLFPLPVHPFNLQNQGVKSYAEWQFEQGHDTIRYYLDKVTMEDMFKDKVVLDIACGAGGKTLYYATYGVRKIYGLDILEKYVDESKKLAESKGLSDRFSFVLGDAAHLPFEDNFFDAIIANDAMEHVGQPLEVLRECYRVLKPGGRLHINFAPYYHPFGMHLQDTIGFPWVQLFFSQKTLVNVYKDSVKNFSDGDERIKFRISKGKNGKEYFSYINKITLKQFKRLLPHTDFKTFYYREVPLRKAFALFAKTPVIKECFLKMVVCIFEK
ncbi:MAG: class I SAM-dependent methyltransferase [Bacillota bacterium]|nr:class I SAM-dependent methyltransferase [Bacillota bacterium]